MPRRSPRNESSTSVKTGRNSLVVFGRRSVLKLGLSLDPRTPCLSCHGPRDGRDGSLLLIGGHGWVPICVPCGYAWRSGFRRHVLARVAP
jgi:hypothetical protein